MACETRLNYKLLQHNFNLVKRNLTMSMDMAVMMVTDDMDIPEAEGVRDIVMEQYSACNPP